MYENSRKKYTASEIQLLSKAAALYIDNGKKDSIDIIANSLAEICKRQPHRIKRKLKSYIRAYDE